MIDITLPPMDGSDSVEIIEINVAEGEHVDAGAAILTVESEKASIDIPCEHPGTIRDLPVSIGQEISAGVVLATLELDRGISPTDETHSIEPTRSETRPPLPPAPARQPAADLRPLTHFSPTQAMQSIVRAGPAARRLARELGVDIGHVRGSGNKGRIVKNDVKGYAKSLLQRATPAQAGARSPDSSHFGEVRRQPMSRMEKATSDNMQRAWNEIPHAWISADLDISELDDTRRRLKDSVEGLTMTAFLVKAAAEVLKSFPRFNSALDRPAAQLLVRKHINIGVAVDTQKGLVVPVIKNADQLSTIDIASELVRISKAARENKLVPAEMKGASMTITNLGGFGVTQLQPIVNWPESSILGIARSKRQAVYVGDKLEQRVVLPITLGFDHRIINGADAARFLNHIDRITIDPARFGLESS